MATLKARGREEIVRYVKSLPDSDISTNRKRYLALMNDGTVLNKDTCTIADKPHTWGWKVFHKYRPFSTAEIISFNKWASKEGYEVKE